MKHRGKLALFLALTLAFPIGNASVFAETPSTANTQIAENIGGGV